jgi:hypothetical protein
MQRSSGRPLTGIAATRCAIAPVARDPIEAYLDGMPGYRGHVTAAADEVVHALRSYGVLTQNGLEQILHTEKWHDCNLQGALLNAQRAGRIKPLGDGLWELTEAERAA